MGREPEIRFLSESEGILEMNVFSAFEAQAAAAGFRPLVVPSFVSRKTIERQGVVEWDRIFRVNDQWALAGSAEQGILERFSDQEVEPARYYALNQCFRDEYCDGMFRVREFRKLELFGFARTRDEGLAQFDSARTLVRSALSRMGLPYRELDTKLHSERVESSLDIEVLTVQRGWIETHSMAYFGTRQADQFGFTGARHTWCATGIASPRILIPLRERERGPYPGDVIRVKPKAGDTFRLRAGDQLALEVETPARGCGWVPFPSSTHLKAYVLTLPREPGEEERGRQEIWVTAEEPGTYELKISHGAARKDPDPSLVVSVEVFR